ncbi:MAG: CRISPR-associated protein [Bacteroidota bacterium]|nr:CRISPR-associated protein [Bacteroidota bacterium]
MLINLSNHPSIKWGKKQQQTAAERYGTTQDRAFPQIDPTARAEDIQRLAEKYLADCIQQFKSEDMATAQQSTARQAVHVMGELTFVYAFVKAAAAKNINCVASTTKRTVLEEKDGRKTTRFEFIRFRAYDRRQ